ncbi:succinate dehydrogenase assembly factor 2 [Candidatus Berkiella cookevillensis]|uniref:FAD assembly factor SdhE n=1 Tax=Candidatus Berkiella cookevillensis TaxID=437022 RepID=A0A0Q9YHR8_9GAMM|nr:succinate dehydrogenase assembly factor 2 [Candidatus Berkiella cookevillensis]MCS5708273.1 succinate dehydrogenase assembly factor 2 [Candidatus Berkiella cookevillensis]
MTINKEREKIRWACRRGMLECDLFLVPFFEHCYDSLCPEEKIIFEKLLVESDAELFAWLMQTESPSHSNYDLILEKIRIFKKSQISA